MRSVFVAAILLVLHLFTKANEIDKLTTIKDVEHFLVEKVDSNFIRYADVGDSIVGFLKIDVDRNGLTDLLVNSDHPFVILDSGNGHYERSVMWAGQKTYRPVEIFQAKDGPLLLTKSSTDCGKVSSFDLDTLTFKLGGLIEYNSHPDRLQIEKINLNTHDGYPGMNIEISVDAGRWATCEERYTSKIFAGIVDSAYFDKLMQTINYINLSSLSNSYPMVGLECLWSDQEVYTLEVTFDNGQIKKISDYGGGGTFGLVALYKQLVNLESEKRLEELR